VTERSGVILEDFVADTRRKHSTGVTRIMGKILIDGRYELRGSLGSGGMADVYLAHDHLLDRDVAVKLLKDHYAHNEEFVERFKREARSAASLSHPNIVSIFNWGVSGDGTYYIAMEYLPGGTLKERIKSKGALPARTAAAVALQIAAALRAAHKRDIIHRDIKPRNILITDTGHVKVADFGIARAAETTTSSDLGEILGSVRYMSPEQAMGEVVGPATDLYSLGVVLYEMLTASVPFEVATPEEVSAKHADEPPTHPREINPEVPEGIDALVMRLLSRDPVDRYASATELIEDLRKLRDGLSPVVSLGDDATTASLETPAVPVLATPAPGGIGLRWRKWAVMTAAFVVLAPLSAAGAVGWNPLRDSGAASVPEILRSSLGGPSVGAGQVPSIEDSTAKEAQESLAGAGFEDEVRPRESPAEDAGRVLAQSVPDGKEAEQGSKILLTDGEDPEVARVPDLVGRSYPEAENKLEEAGFMLGGVKEAPSTTVPAGVIIKQNPPPGTALDPNSFVYLTTSVGPPEGSGADEGQSPGATGTQYGHSDEVQGEEEAVADAVWNHYEAIGADNFDKAYSYFGPTFRSKHNQASWIEGEQSYQIQNSTIHSLTVDEVLGTTATATVEVSFIDNTGTPRFVIVWSLVKEGGQWKLDAQISAQRETKLQPDSPPMLTTTPTASPAPSGASVPPVREENELPSRSVNGNLSGSYYGVDGLLRGDHPEESFTSAAGAQYTN
jgi:eukaryotic-like serine/threonine-protein kinase